MPRRRLLDDDLDSEVDRTFDALEMDVGSNRRGSRRVSTGLRTQKDEDEERQKILLEAMNANSTKKVHDPAKNEQMLEAMKIAVTKAKQLAARAFQEDLIDRLPTAVEREPLFQAGSLLDASARIYSFRVDATHTEAYDVRSKLGDPAQPGGSDDQDGRKNSDDINNDSGNMVDDGLNHGKNNENETKKKSKKKGGADAESDSDVDMKEDGSPKKDDVYGVDDLPVYADDSASECDEEKVAPDAKGILKKFASKHDATFESCVKRRGKVPMVVLDTADLNDMESGSEFSSHLYSKATHNFDEGSSSGLLMQNAITSRCGRRYMLHNNCRCARDRRDEKCEGEELAQVWSGIEEAERIGVFNANVGVNDDEQLSVTSDTSRILTPSLASQDSNTDGRNSAQTLQKNMEAVIEQVLAGGGNKKLFQWRRNLQKRLRVSTKQFVALMAHSLRDWDTFLSSSLIRQTVSPTRTSYIDRIADVRSGLTYAPIADELEPFEESFCWKVCQLRWNEMSNERRAKALQSIPGEHPTYNYFFARSNDEASAEPDEIFSNLPVCRFIGEFHQEIQRDATVVTGEDQKALAGVLESVRVGKGDSLFDRKGEEFGKKIAQMPIVTPMKRTDQTMDMRQVRDSCDERLSKVSRSVVVDDALSLDGGTSVNCNDEMDVENETDFDVASTHVDENGELSYAHTSQPNSVFDKSERPRLDSALRSDTASAYGDLHFVDGKRVAIMAYSIVNDETHWKKRKLDKYATNVTKEKPPPKPDKPERKKPKKDEEKDNFEIGDFDRLPLSVIRDRQRQTRRCGTLVRREDEVLRPPHTRIATELLYKPEQFCRLAHVFMGEWGNIRFNRASSLPDESCENRLKNALDDSLDEEMMVEKAIKSHLSLFDEFFDDSLIERRPASAPCDQQANNSFQNDNMSEFSEDVPCHNADGSMGDDESTIRVVKTPVLKATQSFYSDADSGSEEAEMFGVKYSIRQRRINAPAVKRAIGTILSNMKLDADALNREFNIAREQGLFKSDDYQKLDIISQDCSARLSLSGQIHADIDVAEEQQQLREEEEMNDDPTCELRHAEVTIKNLKLSGRHTFSSVLSQLPSYLAGRTADDLNPICAFSVLLHLCNENNLELLQRKDEKGSVKAIEMDDFTVVSSNNMKNSRKRAAS